MQETNLTAKTIYRPIPFLLSVFSITWLCAILMTITDYNAHPVLFTVLDFLENASPLICVFVLLKKPLSPMPSLFHFLLGKAGHPAAGRAHKLSGCGAYRVAQTLPHRI